MLRHETALALKEAGFPQEGDFWWSEDEHDRKGWEIYYREESLGMEEWFTVDKTIHILAPTLSELIEACGDRFISLFKTENDWRATGEITPADLDRFQTLIDEDGSIPEEAVARLWLALHETNGHQA